MLYKCSNEEMANAIKDFFIKKGLTSDILIYYDGKRISFDDGIPVVKEGYKASKYFEFAVDDWVSMSFEGPFNHMMNYPCCLEDRQIVQEFEELLDSLGGYSEMGYAWSLNVVPNNN